MKVDGTMMSYTAVLRKEPNFCGIESVRMMVIKSEREGLHVYYNKQRTTNTTLLGLITFA